MDYKNIISSILAFATVVFLYLPTGQALFARGGGVVGGNIMIPIFVVIVLTQTLLEIWSKYQNKACESIEGFMTAIAALIGYGIYTAVGRYGAVPGSVVTMDMAQIMILGAIIAGTVFLYKTWIKPKNLFTITQCTEVPAAPVVVVAAPAPITVPAPAV